MATEIIPHYEIGGKIVGLVTNAPSNTRVYLISPFLATWGNLENAIAATCKRDVITNVVYRADKRTEYKAVVERLQNLGATVGEVKLLHAKLYISDTACIITSMNLYDFSSQNSEEFGIISTDPKLLADVTQYAEQLVQRAEMLKPKSLLAKVGQAAGKVAGAAAVSVGRSVVASFQAPGHCIRCSEEIDFDVDHPLCGPHYKEWAKYKNRDYQEKFCHKCGKPAATSLAKPLCRTCWKPA